MLSDEEREALEILNNTEWDGFMITIKNLIEKQSKEIEELKETLKCTQNSWYEDTQKIEEMKKQIDLDNECEIALNNKIIDLENADKRWKDKIKAKIEDILNSENSEAIEKLIEWQSLLEKE